MRVMELAAARTGVNVDMEGPDLLTIDEGCNPIRGPVHTVDMKTIIEV